MRHTGKWQEIYFGLSLEESLKAVEEDPFFAP